MNYDEIVRCRRDLWIESYKTLADVDLEGPWVSPYQIASRSPDGPVLLAYHWLDAPSATKHREELRKLGYLPRILFNKVIDEALRFTGMRREDVYVTQVFHLLPSKERSEPIPVRWLDTSFDAVTRNELIGRRVIALGNAADRACRRHGIEHYAVAHPSSRGRSVREKARELGELLGASQPYQPS
jgi:hypothetical protein